MRMNNYYIGLCNRGLYVSTYDSFSHVLKDSTCNRCKKNTLEGCGYVLDWDPKYIKPKYLLLISEIKND